MLLEHCLVLGLAGLHLLAKGMDTKLSVDDRLFLVGVAHFGGG